MEQENQIKITALQQYIEELQNKQQELVVKFSDKNKEIEQVVANYNAKIEVLQRDGQQAVDNLDNEREQIRGSYQMLTNLIAEKQAQLNELLGTDTKNESELVKESVEELKAPKRGRSSKKVEDSGLTEEQVQAIKEITDQDKQSEFQGKVIPQNQTKESDIPDYLLNEYKK